MTENFTDLTEQIEKRKSAVIQALKDEITAIEQMESKLLLTYEESVINVSSSLIDSIQVVENEQLEKYSKIVKASLLNSHKQHKQLLKFLVPGAFLLGGTIGILTTLLIIK